jgi:dTDP-4-dehydrorhamnose reductase
LEKKTLILGASGFVGGHMYARLGSEKSIAVTYSSDATDSIHFDALKMDLSDVIADFEEVGHAMIFYGETHPDRCAQDSEWSQALNVESTKRVIDCLAGNRIPLTFTSSEFVFDGERGSNIETDSPRPINLYGQQKLEIERYLQSTVAEWTVMRLGKVFASDGANAKLFVGWIQDIEAGNTMRVATDQVFSPILVNDVVSGCLLAAEKKVRGLFHLCGLRPVSRHELCLMLIEAVRGYRSVDAEVVTCSIDDFELPEPRPKDCSMLPNKLIAATGLNITPIEDVCRDTVRRYYEAVEE